MLASAFLLASRYLVAVQAGGPQPKGVIDFEGLSAGNIVSVLSPGSGISGNINGTVGVNGFNPIIPGSNAAMIFDSSCPPGFQASDCSGGDRDLGTPNEAFKFKPLPGSPIPGPGVGSGGFPSNNNSEGNILIISEDDLNSNDPDDANVSGAFVDFDFTTVQGDVTVNSVTIVDVERGQGEAGTFVEFFTNGSPTVTDMVAIPPTGNNGIAEIKNLKLENVDSMVVNLNGSAAILSVIFGSSEKGVCWSTSGGFQNAGFQSGGKDFTFGGNVGPPPSGVWEVVDHNTGDNFHSNDVEVVECLVIEALTGPRQPGGKKGLEDNLLLFKGTGRLRKGDGTTTNGHPFQGCVIDSGEPPGKQGLDKDYFEIVVCDNAETLCPFSSGVCSINTTSADLEPTGPQDACNALIAGADPVVFAACGALDGGNFQIHPPTGNK